MSGAAPPRPFRVGLAGRRIGGLAAGAGPPVVLLHGLGSRGAEILAPFLPLADRVRLVAPDRPGYGDSDPPPADRAGPDGQARMLRSALRELGVRRAVLVGHSYGASVALAWAAQAPDTAERLVLLAPFAAPTREAWMPLLRLAAARGIGPAVRRTVLRWAGPRIARRRLPRLFRPNPVPPTAAALPVETYADERSVMATARDLRAFNGAAAAIWPGLRRLRVPTTVAVGDADPILDGDRHAEMLRRVLLGARVVVLRGVGHMPHHVAPDAVRALVRRGVPGGRPEA